ncbi:MAG TPA: response regulator transcription factor [Anaerolineales bacterium]|nr:response regulator transcription factor [Anaerolineales bacterium]
MKKIKVLVVEDQSVVREGVVAILSLQDDIEVVGEAKDGIDALELAKKNKPDVVLLDMVMPRQDGLTSIPLLKDLVPNAQILVLTSFAESNRVYQAIKLGALGYLLKDTTRVQLLQSIRDVSKGQASIQPSIAMKVIHEIDNPIEDTNMTETLTRRELETLRLIARGLSNQEIALMLVLHERTIAKYVSSILNKLHLANRTQAALYAIDQGLTTSLEVS